MLWGSPRKTSWLRLTGRLPDLFRGITLCVVSTVAEISEAIEKLDVKQQLELLRVLPGHLKISPENYGWSKLAESAFDFWINPEDAICDKL
jgi:hypothetical protein